MARAGLLVIVALAALACTVYGKDWTSLWIYVSAAVGMVLTAGPGGRRVAVRGVLAVTACYVFFSWLSHDDVTDFLVVALPVLLIGLAMIGFRLQMQLMGELAQARETVAKLAANDERLRLARDMHDLTGQSLSMITLKAELAAKRLARLEPSAERDAVLGDLGDIGAVSRQTLHDIREAVSGYRRPTLAIEAITAQNALDRGRDPARRRPRADAAVRHVRRRRRGGAGLVPARGGHQRDPALRCEDLPHPADRTPRRALSRNRR